MSSTRSPVRKEPAIRPRPGWAGPAGDLLLVAHGSARSAAGTAATRGHVDRLRRQGLFGMVHAGFLFGHPTIEDALAATRAPVVHVVPFLMSDGAYTHEVIPARLGLPGPDTGRLHYGQPVGTHPGLAAIVARRAGDLCRAASVPSTDTTLMLVGHGSPRDRASARATHACAERIRANASFASVRTAFLDEQPALLDALSDTGAQNLVVAGFFADEGRHAGEDVRVALELAKGQSTRRRLDGSLLAYTGAVGTDPAMVDIIVARAMELMDSQPLVRRSA